MKYCCKECTRIATNKRVMEQYYEDRARTQGKTRWCRSCNRTKLSRYNTSPICSSCKAQKEIDAKNSVLEMIQNTTFVP